MPLQSNDAGVLNDVYSYDQDANVAGIADLQLGTNNRTMTYDGLDRLIGTSAPNLWGNATYGYDAIDNLTSSTITAGTTARSMVHNFDALTNRLTSTSGTAGYSFSYAYDGQGNIVQRGAQTYAFDQGNRMKSATGRATYGYDGLGHRVSVVGTDSVNRVQVYTQAGQMLYIGATGGAGTKYIYLNNHVLAEVGSNGTQYDHTDALGSPVARTDAARAVLSRTRYEPYGYTAAGTVPTIGFTGHVNDADTGLVYMQQRYYDPVAGRFLSIDPVMTDANTGGSFNRYAYANNNPYKYVDPDGRDNTQVFDWGKGYESRILANPRSLVGQPTFKNEKGEGQCVELVKQTVGNGQPASTWRQGSPVDANTPVGTAVANFNTEGKFDTKNTGQHAAVLSTATTDKGSIKIVDQWESEKRPNIGERPVLKVSPTQPTPSNNAKDYSVILFKAEKK
ncbi:MAG: BPSL0067 family protein [Pseudomonadota bacterium]